MASDASVRENNHKTRASLGTGLWGADEGLLGSDRWTPETVIDPSVKNLLQTRSFVPVASGIPNAVSSPRAAVQRCE